MARRGVTADVLEDIVDGACTNSFTGGEVDAGAERGPGTVTFVGGISIRLGRGLAAIVGRDGAETNVWECERARA
jgi:hypothetical protein